MLLRGVLSRTTALFALVACAGPQGHELAKAVPEEDANAYLADKPEPAKKYFERVMVEGQRNEVLNEMRAGLAAMETGSLDVAAASFDAAINKIETIYADNPQAEQARSNFTKENVKDFKGEPYERAMAFYYRGLIYLMNGEYDNARASFRGGQLQDSLAEDKKYAADFASLAWLEGWSERCLGNGTQAEERFAEAAQMRSTLPPPLPDADLLVVAESGAGPIKKGKGSYRELLAFDPGADEPSPPQVTSHDAVVQVALAEDIYYQAITRGGRQIDGVNQGKAEFKDTTKTVGAVGMGGGIGLSQAATQNMQRSQSLGQGVSNTDLTMGWVGIGMMAAGLVSDVFSNATTPQADTRYWDTLPARIYLGAVVEHPAMPEPVQVASISGPDVVTASVAELIGDVPTTQPGAGPASPDAAAIGTLQEIAVRYNPAVARIGSVHRPGACAIVWVRGRSALDAPASAPGAVASS